MNCVLPYQLFAGRIYLQTENKLFLYRPPVIPSLHQLLEVKGPKRCGHKMGLRIIQRGAEETYSYRTIFAFQIRPPHHIKTGVVHSLVKRGKVTCQEQKYINRKNETINHDLTLNGYPQHFTHSIIKSRRNKNPPSDKFIPYLRGIYEKSRCTESRYNSFKT